MEIPPGDNGAYEAPGTIKTLYRKVQRGLRRLSGVEVQHTSPPTAAKEVYSEEKVQPNQEGMLWLGREVSIPGSVVDNETWVIMGRNPDTTSEKYKKLPKEHHIQLLPLTVDVIPQRAVAFKFNKDGSMLVMNLWDRDLTWGLSESQKLPIRPMQMYSINARQNTANLRFDLPKGFTISAKSVGGSGGEPQRILTMAFEGPKS
jgi:hypothetical protein